MTPLEIDLEVFTAPATGTVPIDAPESAERADGRFGTRAPTLDQRWEIYP